MALEVYLREGESQDSLLKRFQRGVQMSGVLREVKAHSRFISKGDAARIKAKNNARRKRRERVRIMGIFLQTYDQFLKSVFLHTRVDGLQGSVIKPFLKTLSLTRALTSF